MKVTNDYFLHCTKTFRGQEKQEYSVKVHHSSTTPEEDGAIRKNGLELHEQRYILLIHITPRHRTLTEGIVAVESIVYHQYSSGRCSR